MPPPESVYEQNVFAWHGYKDGPRWVAKKSFEVEIDADSLEELTDEMVRAALNEEFRRIRKKVLDAVHVIRGF